MLVEVIASPIRQGFQITNEIGEPLTKMTLWRLNIKTSAQDGFDPRQFCLEKKLAGVGWPVEDESGRPPKDFDHYLKLGQAQYADNGDNGWWPAVNAIGNRMKAGDLCWTRDWNGVYYLGRIDGAWQYLHGNEADNFDVHCVRSCKWVRVGLLDAVPGAVERSFGPSRTVQAVNDETADAYSHYVYGQLSGDPTIATNGRPDIFALLSPLDHEDLAALYLQTRGYALVPSTIKSSTAAYEWVMFHQETGEKAVLQVKSGNAWIDLAPLAEIPSRVFVVAADGTANVTCISREQLLRFAQERRALLPERIRRYLDWASV
jgi:hypothetical protein